MTQQTFCNNPFYKKNVRNNRKYTNLSMKNNLWYGFILTLLGSEEKREKRSCGRFWRAALTGHGQSKQLADF
jgi:hypothetical protein